MAMVNSGPISLGGNATSGGLNQSVNIELNRAATASINMNESAVRTLAAVPSGAISMSNFYGKSNRVVSNLTISSDTANYVLNTAKVTGYAAGKTDVTLTINSGIFVFSASTGSYALTVDNSWTTGDTVTIVNNGVIVGRGGNGANASGGGGNGIAGGAAGPALFVQRAITMNNLNRIAGGGGGGASGGGNPGGGCCPAGGGGGGGGIGNSSGGTSPFLSCCCTGNAGSGGSLTSAGGGGSGSPNGLLSAAPGGDGGGYGSSGGSSGGGSGSAKCGGGSSSGASGGAAGACIVGNSNITYINTGTRNGSIS